MSGQRYSKGYRLERAARSCLEDRGYFVIRSAGSKSPVDLIAIRRGPRTAAEAFRGGRVLFVQCKATPRGLSAGEWNTFWLLADDCDALPVLCGREDRQPMTWHLITGRREPYSRDPPSHLFAP